MTENLHLDEHALEPLHVAVGRRHVAMQLLYALEHTLPNVRFCLCQLARLFRVLLFFLVVFLVTWQQKVSKSTKQSFDQGHLLSRRPLLPATRAAEQASCCESSLPEL